jgi:hypothetical protein
MERKLLGPAGHTGLDVSFAAMSLLAPSAFNLKGPARTLCYFFGGSATLLTAFTDQPYAMQRLIPFNVHGAIDAAYAPALLVLPTITGAMKKRKARNLFLGLFAMAVTSFLITDYHANEPEKLDW